MLRDQHHASADRVRRIIDSVDWLRESCTSYGAEEGSSRIWGWIRAAIREQDLDGALEASCAWLKTHLQDGRSERVLARLRRADEAAGRRALYAWSALSRRSEESASADELVREIQALQTRLTEREEAFLTYTTTLRQQHQDELAALQHSAHALSLPEHLHSPEGRLRLSAAPPRGGLGDDELPASAEGELQAQQPAHERGNLKDEDRTPVHGRARAVGRFVEWCLKAWRGSALGTSFDVWRHHAATRRCQLDAMLKRRLAQRRRCALSGWREGARLAAWRQGRKRKAAWALLRSVMCDRFAVFAAWKGCSTRCRRAGKARARLEARRRCRLMVNPNPQPPDPAP